MTKTALHITALATALLLAACGGKKNDDGNNDAPPAGSLLEAAKEKGAETAKQDALPKPDTNKPLSSYPELDSGQQVMFLYAAASKLPPDFEKMAEVYSREYRQTNDAFRKSDLLKAIQPQLEQNITQAAAQPYAWVGLDDAQLESYDFQRKGFPVGEFSRSISRYFSDASQYTYTWINRDQLAFAPVADEAIAREMESMRGKWDRKPHLKIYFFAQSADLNAQKINAVVTRVQITDRSGRVLAEYGPDGSVPAATPPAESNHDDAAAAAAAAFG
ncbi:hypothetical protein ACSBPQ_00470 [Stenotrophomonas sp. JC08]|uniref:hypothetical protein n=1 Tax=Stenotrophomonas sp. JC08 TaxID=3445779 RepID=UPI003FA1C0B0